MKTLNSKQKIIISISMVVVLALLVIGSTYSYFMWNNDLNNRTNLTFTISKSGFTIEGTNVGGNWLVPTTNCASQVDAMMGKARVSARNKTATPMRASIVLKGKLTPASGRTFVDEKSYIHWAIHEVADENEEYSNAYCQVGAASSSAATGTFTNVGSNYTDVNANIYFDVAAKQNVTKYYQIYVWIDSSYESLTIGDAIQDVMQGLSVELVFSDESSLVQLVS